MSFKTVFSPFIDNDPKYLSLPGSYLCASELPPPLHLVKLQFMHIIHMSVKVYLLQEADVMCMLQGHWVGAVSYPHCE